MSYENCVYLGSACNVDKYNLASSPKIYTSNEREIALEI